MQELVEMIRRDHALLHDLVVPGRSGDAGPVLEAHRTLLDTAVAPLVEALHDERADEEWAIARDQLDAAIAAADSGAAPEELRRDLDAHAEQMEQVVLARLLSETDELTLSDQTAEALRAHEALGLGSGRPAAMRATTTGRGGDASRPAGAEEPPDAG